MTVKPSTANAPTLQDGFDQIIARFVEVVHDSAARGVYPRACGGTDAALMKPWSYRVYPRACGGTYVPPVRLSTA